MKAKLVLNKDFIVGKIDPRLYGSFIEHMGRAVYHGIYEPTHSTADDMGFRKDVMELVLKLNVSIVRYPGGNFVSGYNWEDGIGLKEKRPHTTCAAWQSIEPNEVGVDEFREWCKRANTEMMLVVNLGTKGPEEAKNLLEYCNFEKGSKYSNMRCENGHEKPYNVHVWCLGNEMDGDWQIGVRTPADYAAIAKKTALLMKRMDPSIELVACGSSSYYRPTFGQWEQAVLEAAYDNIEYLSLHQYLANNERNTASYLGCTQDMDKFIKTLAAACDFVKGKKRTNKTINLSFDEWNVWSVTNKCDNEEGMWQIAPRREEHIYNLEDALVFGCMMMTLLKNCDRVKMACQAQLVNVAGLIMTENNGRAWAQTIYYPFMHASNYGRGTTLVPKVHCDSYHTDKYGEVPYVETVGVMNEEADELTVFAVNRNLEDATEMEIDLSDFEGYRLVEHIVLEHEDVNAYNTADNPNKVAPHSNGKTIINDKTAIATLNKQSWNVIRFKKG